MTEGCATDRSLKCLSRAAMYLARFASFSQIREGCEHKDGDRCVHAESNGATCSWQSCPALLRR